MQDFKNLRVYTAAHALCLDIYGALRDFPSSERFGLADQLRRAAVSVPSNISESCGTSTNKAMVKYLMHSLGSCKEIECQLLLSKDLGYLQPSKYEELNEKTVSVAKQLSCLIKALGDKK